VAYIRIFRHYVHTPYLLMAAADGLLLVTAAYLGQALLIDQVPSGPDFAFKALVFAVTIVFAMVAMGVYESRIREGYSAMMLRTAVALFLLGAFATIAVSTLLPALVVERTTLLYVLPTSFGILAVWRLITPRMFPEDALKQRVVVLGTGRRAQKIAARMRRSSDQRAFVLVGFLERDRNSPSSPVEAYRARVIRTDLPLREFCEAHDVDEIVVAIDERRRNLDAGGGIPLEELLECRLSGIRVCDVEQFIEREAGRIDVDLLRPSWVVFSDGFVTGAWRATTKRSFDVVVSLLLLLAFWPIMILVALAVFAEGGFRGPVLLRQERVGLNGRHFRLLKFRSMIPEAEPDGIAVWASRNESRVTRVGNILRNARLDELPQLFNVLKGDMSFVGPRPERPVFVEELSRSIPFYAERHRIKPGITGWAQLCYPYGASVQDAKEKLEYDLYYLKNHSILLDLVILLQTVEVVLVGEGAR
jgi:sugar transferase (PEP-CTERM system associated)